MSGSNILLDMPPGIFSDNTQYKTGKRWYAGNMVRWTNNILTPIGGWRNLFNFQTGPGTPTTPVRKLVTWRDNAKAPLIAAGTADKLIAGFLLEDGNYTMYDITPASLGWNPGSLSGYGRLEWGSGYWGLDDVASVDLDGTGLWSLDNLGEDLFAVHSQDGRLTRWDPDTPSTPAAVVAGAPIDNTLVVVTEEEHVMLLGGLNNPRRIAWSSRRDYSDWTPTESNSAGSFDLKSYGVILAACKVQGGILVITDADVHLIEYVGPPNYYGRRKISDEGSVVGQNALTAILGGAMWMGNSNVFQYVGGAVSVVPCTVHSEMFYNSNLTQQHLVHMGVNEYAQEVWFFYPSTGSDIPNRYAAIGYGSTKYWTSGALTRTAWCNPLWQSRPLACNDRMLYEQEFGALDDGASRSNVYVESGVLDVSNGDANLRFDRVYQDQELQGPDAADPDAYTITFKLRQAPNAPQRTFGPYHLNQTKGFRGVRFRARQAVVRIDQYKDQIWEMGQLRLRVKPGGKR